MTIEDFDRSITNTVNEAVKKLPVWAVTGILRQHADTVSFLHIENQRAAEWEKSLKKQQTGIVSPNGAPVPPSGK